MSEPALRVVDAPDRRRYEGYLEGLAEPAAIVTYRRDGERVALLHTEVRPEHEGRGIASRIVTAVFEDARARGLRVIARCPYILAWLPRHPEVHDLLETPPETADPG